MNEKIKIRITYTVCGMDFVAEVSNISEAYEYLKAIIINECISFPNREETLSEYMAILADFKNGNKIKCENHIFAIEAVQEKMQNEQEKTAL